MNDRPTDLEKTDGFAGTEVDAPVGENPDATHENLIPPMTMWDWCFWALHVVYAVVLFILGVVHRNDCDAITSLPVWAVVWAVIMFYINVVCRPFLMQRLQQQYPVLKGMIYGLILWGAALTFPNVGIEHEACDEALFGVSFFSVIGALAYNLIVQIYVRTCLKKQATDNAPTS